MNEHQPHTPGRRPEPAEPTPPAEKTARSGPEREASLEESIDAGIAAALEADREVDLGTAVRIAEALSRATGPHSALGRFADTATGSYPALREEYLDLYTDPDTPEQVKQWINWLGTFLIQREQGTRPETLLGGRTEHDLQRPLVRTSLPMQQHAQPATVPATLNARDIIRLAGRIEALDEYQDSAAFRAYLTLADVNAADAGLVDSFRENYVGSWYRIEDAIRELVETDSLERDLRTVTEARGLPEASVSVNVHVLEDCIRDVYDIVEHDGRTHVFRK